MSILSSHWRQHLTWPVSRTSEAARVSSSINDESASQAIELQFEELIAQKPHRWPASLAAGVRGPDGERPGRGRARSLSFDGVSPYQNGDDPRWVDWRATARSGLLQVKRFAAQSHRARVIVLPLDTNLLFGTAQRVMAKTAALIAARLAFDAQVINEPIGLVCSGQEPLIAKRGRRHLWLLLERIHQQYNDCLAAALDTPTQGATVSDVHDDELLAALENAQSMLGKGDEICLVDEAVDRNSGFDQWSKAAAARHALKCFLVRDRLTQGHLVAGRYPARLSAMDNSVTCAIPARQVERVNAEITQHQNTLAEHLTGLGWQVTYADDVLSRALDGVTQ